MFEKKARMHFGVVHTKAIRQGLDERLRLYNLKNFFDIQMISHSQIQSVSSRTSLIYREHKLDAFN